MTKTDLTLQRIELGGSLKVKSSLVVGIPTTPCPSPEAYPEWLDSIIQAINDLQGKAYFYRVSERYSQLATTLSDTCGPNEIEKNQVPWFGWSRIVLPVA